MIPSFFLFFFLIVKYLSFVFSFFGLPIVLTLDSRSGRAADHGIPCDKAREGSRVSTSANDRADTMEQQAGTGGGWFKFAPHVAATASSPRLPPVRRPAPVSASPSHGPAANRLYRRESSWKTSPSASKLDATSPWNKYRAIPIPMRIHNPPPHSQRTFILCKDRVTAWWY